MRIRDARILPVLLQSRKIENVSLRIAAPIVESAANESHTELQDLPIATDGMIRCGLRERRAARPSARDGCQNQLSIRLSGERRDGGKSSSPDGSYWTRSVVAARRRGNARRPIGSMGLGCGVGLQWWRGHLRRIGASFAPQHARSLQPLPHDYVETSVLGFANLLKGARAMAAPSATPGTKRHSFWFVYAQVTGVLSALTIAHFLRHFVRLDWHALIAPIIDGWAAIVRPLAHEILYWTAGLVARLLGVDIDFPLIVQDYLAVGLILLISYVRGFASLHDFRSDVVFADFLTYWRFWLWDAVRTLLLWPYMILRFIYWLFFPLGFARKMLTQTVATETRAHGEPTRPYTIAHFARLARIKMQALEARTPTEEQEWAALVRRWALLSLSPLVYLGLLFVIDLMLKM